MNIMLDVGDVAKEQSPKSCLVCEVPRSEVIVRMVSFAIMIVLSSCLVILERHAPLSR